MLLRNQQLDLFLVGLGFDTSPLAIDRAYASLTPCQRSKHVIEREGSMMPRFDAKHDYMVKKASLTRSWGFRCVSSTGGGVNDKGGGMDIFIFNKHEANGMHINFQKDCIIICKIKQLSEGW